jgi:voltage-gated potassium channel
LRTNRSQALIIREQAFVFLVTLLSIVNGVLWFFPLEPYTRSVIQIIEYVISLFLLLDFFFRLIRARDKRLYFFQYYGWLDFLGSLPVFGLRLARLASILIQWRKIRRDELSAMGNVIVRQRAQSTLFAVIFIALVIFEVSGIAILTAETQSPEANIQTAGDALWWAYVTVATVGYGDATRWRPTADRRILLMTAGWACSACDQLLADWFRATKTGSRVKLVERLPRTMPVG